MAKYVECNRLVVSDARAEWCDRCHTVHMHARVYVVPASGNLTEATPGRYRDCARMFDHVWQDD